MRNANKRITLYNFYGSKDDPDILESKRLYIRGVSVYAQTQVEVTADGLVSANVYTIRIPRDSTDEAYLPPMAFNILADKTGVFTLAKGDKIVLGLSIDENPRQSDLEKKYGNEMVVTITGVTDNRSGKAPHWKVIGQ